MNHDEIDPNGFDATRIDCWMSLVGAMLDSARKENDQYFLNSEWGDSLMFGYSEWERMRSNRNRTGILSSDRGTIIIR